jgi:hypothetical protein
MELGMKLGELGVRSCMSMYLYREEERLSLTYIPGPAPSNMGSKNHRVVLINDVMDFLNALKWSG